MDLRWHGHSFFSLTCRDGTKILVDPFVENGRTRRRVADFAPDFILVTHAHDDHVGSATEFGVPCVATYELAGILESRGARGSVGMNVGGFWRRGGVRVWCAPAWHSSGFHGGEQGGVACGFVVDDGETRFHHAGDTGIFGDMRTVIRDLLQPHVAAVPIGDFYTMGAEHAARAVEWLGVNVAVPMHYDTFPAIHADPHDFEKRVGTAAKVVIPPVDGGFEMHGPKLGKMLAP
jgi:L-ascorbate metabolism protein UlaG (beta-lactamase superfamily)